MRKLILRWLLGADFKDYNELFGDCVELLKHCKEVVVENQKLFERCDKLLDIMEKMAYVYVSEKGGSDGKNTVN